MKSKLLQLRGLAIRHADKAAAAAALIGSSVMAHATAIVDYSSATTAATAELTSSITTALPLFGVVTGIVVTLAIVKRFRK